MSGTSPAEHLEQEMSLRDALKACQQVLEKKEEEEERAMRDPMAVLDDAMDDYAAREPAPPLSAQRIAFESAEARRRLAQMYMAKAQAERRVADAKEGLALIEAMEIDAWLGTITPDQIKARYGSNETERERNTRIMLHGSANAGAGRVAVQQAEGALDRAVAQFLSAQAAVEHWQAVAWAYGGECNMAAAPARPTMMKVNKAAAIPADLMGRDEPF